MRVIAVAALSLLVSQLAFADAVVLEKDSVGHRAKAGQLKAGDKRSGVRVGPGGSAPSATGSVALIDSSGLKYFINTNITFSTSSSASAAMSEASYTGPVQATTLNGGTVASTLNDGFDGYDAMCVSLTNATGPCATGNASYTIYNKNGPATLINGGREVQFNAQTIGPLSVSRRVYVPATDSFSRTINSFTNTSASAVTFTMITSNNLGSDSNTTIVSSSSGDAVVTTSDFWATTFQAFSGTTSSDPRLFHVMWGPGASIPVTGVSFANGDDNPFWSYRITLNPGETKLIVNFAGGTASKTAAAAKATQLASFAAYPNALVGMSPQDLAQTANFVSVQAVVPTTGATAKAILATLLVLMGLGLFTLRQRSAV